MRARPLLSLITAKPVRSTVTRTAGASTRRAVAVALVKGLNMTAEQLIKALSELPPETIIFVWDDGARRAIDDTLPVDFWDDFHADINLELSE